MITVAKKDRKIQKRLVEKVDKAAMAKVVKITSNIDISNKYKWAITNDDLNITRDLKLIGVKKYQRCVGKI